MAKIYFDIDNKCLVFKCPGCLLNHVIATDGLNSYHWNKSLDRPSISQTVNIEKYTTDQISLRCRFNVYVGAIEFSHDSTHKMRGKKVNLPEYVP